MVRWSCLCAIPLALLFGNSSISAASHVVDGGRFFQPDVLANAEERLSKLQQSASVRVQVATFEGVPAADRDRVRTLDLAGRESYFSNWIRTAERDAGKPDVFLLICRDPSHLRLGFHDRVRSQGWSDAERREMVDGLMANFRKSDFDKGLEQFLAMLELRAAKKGTTAPANAAPSLPGLPTGLSGALPLVSSSHVASDATAHSSRVDEAGSWASWAILAVIVIGGFLLVSMLARAFAGAMGGGGGGGLLGGLMAGLGGAMLGNWLYDSFAGSTVQADEGTRDAGADSGFSSTGADWGADAGGFDDGGDF